MATTPLIASLTIDFGDIRTVISAERAIARASIDLRWYGMEHPSADQWARDLEALTMAIHATTGETPAALLERMAPKIDRAYARQEKASAEQARRLGWPIQK
jgi:hypothetical protein